MSMMRGLCTFVIVLQIVVILFLVFQIQDTTWKCKDERQRDQERVTKAARLIVQSATQSHPLFAHDHATEAKFLLDEIIESHGGVVMTEKVLKLSSGKLETLRNQIYDQHQEVQAFLMDKIIEKHPKFDTELNDAAGLRHRRKSTRTRARSSSPKREGHRRRKKSNKN